MDLQTLIEQLAEKEHGSWSHWMKYLFSQCESLGDGSVTIPSTLVERWQRQMNTSYADLTEKEKQSDRNRVQLILPIIEEYKQDGESSDEQVEVTRPQIGTLVAMVERNSLDIPIGASLEVPGEITFVNISASHIRIIGSSRSGKTCLVTAIIDILQQTHDAGFLQIALLDLEDKTGKLFEGMAHLASITHGSDQPVPLHARNPRQVVEYLHLIRNLMDERYTLPEEEQAALPHLLVYIEEFLSLKSHPDLDESLYSSLIEDLNELVIRGLKVQIHLMYCAQADYADEDLKAFANNVALNIAFAVRPAAARAAGFMNVQLLVKNWQTKIAGQFVVEGTGCNDLCMAPDYDVTEKLKALED